MAPVTRRRSTKVVLVIVFYLCVCFGSGFCLRPLLPLWCFAFASLWGPVNLPRSSQVVFGVCFLDGGLFSEWLDGFFFRSPVACILKPCCVYSGSVFAYSWTAASSLYGWTASFLEALLRVFCICFRIFLEGGLFFVLAGRLVF